MEAAAEAAVVNHALRRPNVGKISNSSKVAGINSTAAIISASQPFAVIRKNALMGIE
jgi:hypothetical protein